MSSIEHMNAEERQRYLDSLEAKEFARMTAELKPVLGPEAAERILASMYAIVNRRVMSSLKPFVEHFGENVGNTIASLLHGRAGPFFVGECTYGDWLSLHSGLVWLEPGVRLRLHFASGSTLEFCFDLEREENSVELVPEGERTACLFLGFQTVARFVPLEVELSGQLSDSLLLQVALTPGSTSRREPVLRLDYALFQRAAP